jgi:3',5'-cyclic-AMP phosphodiesterase
MRAVWLTDIHLNFPGPVAAERFIAEVATSDADCILISGDIGEAPRLTWYLQRLGNRWQRPIYFVLGNHDYYLSSFDEVAASVRRLCENSPHLHWLTGAGIIELTPNMALIGHDSWADGRFGSYERSNVMLNDYVLIHDFRGLDKASRLRKMNALGDAAAAHFQEWLPKAFSRYTHVCILTHVPPFREACWHEGNLSDDNFLPHFACKAVGDTLLNIMADYPDRQLTVLCGHTHSSGRAQIRENLVVLTGEAEYSKPKIQKMIDLT